MCVLVQNRNQVLQQAASDGAVKDYGGWRVSLKGKRFRIKDVRLFNVTELDGKSAHTTAASAVALLHSICFHSQQLTTHSSCVCVGQLAISNSHCQHLTSQIVGGCSRCSGTLLPDPTGTPWGQSAVFSQYELEDGSIVTVQGEEVGPSIIEVPPSQEDVAAAEAAVQEQAAAVRALKEGQGLTNADPQVQNAVAELQQRKDTLAKLQERYQAAVREAEADAAAPATIDSAEE